MIFGPSIETAGEADSLWKNLCGAVSEVAAPVTFFSVRALTGVCHPPNPLRHPPPLVSLPPALPTQQKEKKVNLKAEEGHSMILNCNPPQSSMQPIIHWMDSGECVSPPSLPPLHTSCRPTSPSLSVMGTTGSYATSVSHASQWSHASGAPFESNSFFL